MTTDTTTNTDTIFDEDDYDLPDTCLNRIDGHWYVITYGRAPYQIHATDCPTCHDTDTDD